MAIGNKRRSSQSLSKRPLDLPAGTVHAFAGTSAPEGWAMCDGSEVSKTTYAALYAVIADTYGTPVDSSNFVLPDLRGEFVRGLDDMGTAQGARGVDSGRSLGSAQNDTTRRPRGTAFGTDNPGNHNHGGGNHSHQFNCTTSSNGNGGPDLGDFTNVARFTNSSGTIINNDGSHTHNITTGGDAETRPRNCAMNYIIKL